MNYRLASRWKVDDCLRTNRVALQIYEETFATKIASAVREGEMEKWRNAESSAFVFGEVVHRNQFIKRFTTYFFLEFIDSDLRISTLK